LTPDVNVLVAASRADHPHHAVAKAWMLSAMDNARTGVPLGLLGTVVASYLRLVTHRKVFAEPTPMASAIAYVDALLQRPGVSMLVMQDEWAALKKLCLDLNLSDNDVPDVWIAASVLQRQETLATFDRDFMRLLPAQQLLLLKPSVH
jgi:toxin-antitoxin system PIN domain toxin